MDQYTWKMEQHTVNMSKGIQDVEKKVRNKIIHLVPKPLHKFSITVLIITVIILIFEFYRAVRYDLNNQRRKDEEQARKTGGTLQGSGMRQNIKDILEEIDEERGTKKSKVRNMFESARDGLITGLIAGALTGDYNNMVGTGVSMCVVGAVYAGLNP